MISLEQARTLAGKTMVGAGGEKIGKIDTLYADREDGEPTFATVHTGAFGGRTSFVPVADASLAGDTLTVPYDNKLVHDAPQIEPDSELEPAEEERLYTHYGVQRSGVADTYTQTAEASPEQRTGTVGDDTSGPTTDEAMTRSEERLQVGTQQVETGRARLRKYIVTENVTQTVPVSHEEVRIEREPITDANAGQALDGPELSEEEHEVILHAERPVVAKETVPVERVRLDTETVTEQQTVTEQVRKEQIEVDDPTVTGTTGTTGTTGKTR